MNVRASMTVDLNIAPPFILFQFFRKNPSQLCSNFEFEFPFVFGRGSERTLQCFVLTNTRHTTHYTTLSYIHGKHSIQYVFKRKAREHEQSFVIAVFSNLLALLSCAGLLRQPHDHETRPEHKAHIKTRTHIKTRDNTQTTNRATPKTTKTRRKQQTTEQTTNEVLPCNHRSFFSAISHQNS